MTRHHFDVDAFLTRLWALDAALVAAGFHEMSPWWRAQIQRFLRSGCRRWVIRAGRRAGKSSTLCRLAVAWALWGPWSVPLGDVAVMPFVSVDRREAGARIRTVAEIFRVLGIPFDQRDGEIEIEAQVRPVLFRVVTCTIRGSVGFTAIAAFCDEVARWENADHSANPAPEVVGELMPTLTTQPFGFLVLSSTPLSTVDFHAECYERGDTDHQLVSFATTWKANPSISEADTHGFEPDERLWLRNFAAVPQEHLSSAWPASVVEEVFRDAGGELEGRVPSIAWGLDDFASGRRDAAVSMVARFWIDPPQPRFLVERRCTAAYGAWDEPLLGPDGQPIPNPRYGAQRAPLLRIEQVIAAEGTFWKMVPADRLVAEKAAFYRKHGVHAIFGDQREAYLLQAAYGRHGLRYLPLTWTSANKPLAVERLRRWLVERMVIAPDHAKLRRELLGFKERVTQTGHITFDGGSGSDDFVACLVTCALAELEGLLPSSPLGPSAEARRERNEGLAQFIRRFGGEAFVDEQGQLHRNLPVVR